ncbi:DUF2599 domain-containing protein [Listeria booriae]|uniref:DUF2599 domain-containing protein n=1 Tax=Listeria booriae TaxID=1552123 RepID=UPI001626373D|nr:DUF2599 domain-containing protein [Listeria booriae]MBC2189631.1 DUF2599 domain-containing protein [Listeria booriae]
MNLTKKVFIVLFLFASVNVTTLSIGGGSTVEAAYLKSYSYYFSSSKWITRNGQVSLSITPKNPLKSGVFVSSTQRNAIINDSFARLKQKHGGSKNWKNESSLKKQYMCHIDHAKGFKVPWNIEPAKKSTSSVTCN